MKRLPLITIMLSVWLLACSAPEPKLATEVAVGSLSAHSKSEGNRYPRASSATLVPCPIALPEDDIEGDTAFCGEIIIPENWNKPDSKQITISYAVFKANGNKPLPDPVIYFDGGPGTSTFGQLAALAGKTFSHLRQNQDLIFWEQRGNLYSSNLDCPDEVRDPRSSMSMEEIEARARAHAATPPPLLDLALLEPTTIYDDPQEALVQDRTLAAYNNRMNNPRRNCRQYYKEKGVDLTQYSTFSSLRDAIALMNELDYPEYNIYGISYGTTLVLETMRYYDDHSEQDLPTVRSVVIDGVSPLYVDMAEQGLIMPYNVLRVFADCEANPICAAAYPGIHQRLLVMLAEIEHHPLTAGDGTVVTLDKLRSLLIFASSNDVASMVYLPRLIVQLEHGKTAIYKLIQTRTGAVAAEVPIGIQAIELLSPDTKEVITCNDRSANLDVDRAFESYRSFEAPQLITDPIAVVQQIINCEAWTLMDAVAPLPAPVTSGLRTLVSNGAMDTATAVDWGELAYKSLPNSSLVIIPVTRHGASAISECGKVITTADFSDPRAVLDLRCIQQAEPVFILPGDSLPVEIGGSGQY